MGDSEAEVRKTCAELHAFWKEVGWERYGLRGHAFYTEVECFGWHVLEGCWDRVAMVIGLCDGNL